MNLSNELHTEPTQHLFLSMSQAEHIYNELGKFLETLKGYSAIGVPVAKLVVSYPCELKIERK